MSAPAPAQPPPPSPNVVPAGLRKDLVMSEQNYLGRKFLVLKNPIGLTFYRMPLAHGIAAQGFDGKRTFGQILEDLRQNDRYWRSLTPQRGLEELATLSRQLAMSGLLRVHGGSAVARAQHIKQAKHKRIFEISVGKILYFRKSLFDPDNLLQRLLPIFGWIYSPVTIGLCLAFFTITLLTVFRNWDAVTEHATNFFTIENLALSWISFFGVKIIHEFGHGLTCKRFGGEVHEMGFMFILFTPYLFCNVSDSWRAPKAHRIYVTAAGIFVELILACFATWIWLFTQPGLLHQMCFNIMFLCSVSTVLFNANPLLKFDGYYIMSDALEIPNLKQKSNMYVTQWAQRVLLGIKSATVRLMSYELNPLFGIYAVLSYLYGWLVLYNISHLLFDKLKPYGLEAVSRTYVGLFLFVSLGLPLYRLAASMKNTKELKKAITPHARITLLVVGVALIAIFFIPWQDTVKRTIVLEHSKTDSVSALYPGFLRELNVHDGQVVKKGDPIGRLDDPALRAEKKDLELQISATEIRYRAAISSDKAELQEAAPTQKKMLDELSEQLKGINDKIASMNLVSPSDGIIRTWKMSERTGQYFSPDHPVCEVGTNLKMRAIIPLNEKEARRVSVGQKVVFRLFAEPDKHFEGTVTSRPVSPLDKFSSPALANMFGGDTPSEHDPDPKKQIRPSTAYYEAEVAIDESDPTLRPGMMGKARIYAGKTTLAKWLFQRSLEYLDPEFRL